MAGNLLTLFANFDQRKKRVTNKVQFNHLKLGMGVPNQNDVDF